LKNPEIPPLRSYVNFEYRLEPGIEAIEAKTWVNRKEKFFELNREFLQHVDDTGNEWVLLIAHTSTSLDGYNNTRCEMWSWGLSYFAPKMIWRSIRKNVLEMDFRDGISRATYELFNREYYWSPGIDDVLIYCESDFDHDSKIKNLLTPTSVDFLWEEQYDSSQDESVSFYMPGKTIVEQMNLSQREYEGSFYTQENELVAFNFRLFAQDVFSGHGLAIRKDILIEFLEKANMDIFWFSFGEKQVIRGIGDQTWSEWKGFYELDSQGKLFGIMDMDGKAKP
jgi:hypothetical protein